jgi:hypothetical protein
MALADKCDPDENSRFLRTLLVMTLTRDPPTSIVRIFFVDIRRFVRFFMMRTVQRAALSPSDPGHAGRDEPSFDISN